MYPPEPWHLRGQMYLSLFLVPRGKLPQLPPVLRDTVRPITVGGRVAVGAAWVSYEPGGVLHYRELLSALLVHERGRPRVSITDIWVDSVASREGGRRLWGIPKEMAELQLDADTEPLVDASASVAPASIPSASGTSPSGTSAGGTFTSGTGGPIGSALVRLKGRLPGRFPLGFTVAQALGDAVRRTPVRGRGGLRTADAAWRADPDGPLAYLAGRRPVLSLAITDFWLVFGSTPKARARAGHPGAKGNARP
ncbi:acetoacetate decarboxylase family protein [Actinoplanes missouriensis]|uniref:acetoacetate decarboxylase family protein n=1 Tax=Actinoplanes missouriensis TaxID=1866 RepID=UPI0033DAB772